MKGSCNCASCRAPTSSNGANPIAIVVPCHREIGANGTLTGYGGGLPRKRWLVEHERRLLQGDLLAFAWSDEAAVDSPRSRSIFSQAARGLR